jgi:aminoglycoside phosphotransferase (APT) family kinase protein
VTDIERPRTTTREPAELGALLQAWFTAKFPGSSVSGVRVPTGTGMSSESVLFDVALPDGTRECVARIEPDATTYPVFPTYDLAKQFRVLQLLAEQSAVPVPEMLWYEGDRTAVGSTFFVMSRVDGEVPPDVMPYPMGSWLYDATVADQERLQRNSVQLLADLHAVPTDDFAFLEYDRPGASALRRHVAEQSAYYEWLCQDSPRVPLLERMFAWLEEHWPADDSGSVISWGDARIGNVLFRDFEPVGVLDWEMVGLAPREVDIAWMIWMHRFLDDFARLAGMPGMPAFMRRDDVASTYEAMTGHAVRDLDWYLMYAALRQALVLSRTARRQFYFGEIPMPENPDDLVINRASIERLLDGTYWTELDSVEVEP